MKRTILIFSLILINLLLINAQDYQIVNSCRIAFFSNEFGSVICIRVDSVHFERDSILYLSPTIEQKENNCFTPYGASFIGRNVIIQANGNNLIVSNDFDTILIKTDAQLNESWTAFMLPDSVTIQARVSALDTLHFLSLIDSVKTIEFQVLDKNSTPVNHLLNYKSISVSKNYGLVKTFNLRIFPDLAPNPITFEEFQECNLIGLSNPKLGIQNLTWFDVNDYQVGDEVHISYYLSALWPQTSESKESIFKYLERTDYAESIKYRIERIEKQKHADGNNTSCKYLHDTIVSIVTPNPEFGNLPGVTLFSPEGIYSYSMQYDTLISKTEPSIFNTYVHDYDSCWTYPIADGCFSADTYIKGLGGPYFSCEGNIYGEVVENKLVYYKKGMDSGGTPLVITAIEDSRIQNETEVYPNPAKDIIYVKVQNSGLPVKFELLNIDGQVVSDNKFSTGSFSVSCGNLEPGIYLYLLHKDGEVVKSGKVVVE